MTEDVVHIREDLRRVSFCGEDLVTSTFDPFLYVTDYNPNRNIYAVMRVVHVGTSYPVFEQVNITINPNLCEHCLAGYGMLLLSNLAENSLCI